jgi:uracil-DNA glycosylase family 4
MAEKRVAPSRRVARIIAQRLESLERAGVTHLPKPRAASGDTTTRDIVPPGRPPDTAPATRNVVPPAAQTDDRVAALAAVARRVAKCTRCQELARSRTQTVFGVGNPHARLVFMGEAPGADEDRQGEPFVGRAGQLLTDIIVKGMRLRREDVYILNTVKCRPPQNRAPEADEAANCREYLDAQLAIIRPEFICCLGAVAAQNLLATSASIGSLRGRVHRHGDIKVICTYHPAYVLRYPVAKRQVWEDIQMLMREMGFGGKG